jgi:CHASE3 domain sensor protein
MIVPVILVVERTVRDAGIPIDGVSIGDPLNRTTWRVFYAATATASQRVQGDSLLLTLDPQDAATVASIKQDLAAGLTSMDALIALGQTAYECAQNPTGFPTIAAFRTRFLQLLKARL